MILKRIHKEGKNTQFLRACRLTTSLVAAASLGACGGGDSSGGPAAAQNSAPVVSADARTLVSAGDAITLTASATDADGDSISFSWQQLNGNPVANTQGRDSANFSFNAPDDVNTLQFRVTATANGQSDSQTVNLIVVEELSTAVFVDTNSTSSGDGSIEAPFNDLLAAITSTDDSADFYIQTPNNNEALELWTRDNAITLRSQSIYGGYTDNWTLNLDNPTRIETSEIGFNYRNIDSNTKVSGINLNVNNATFTSPYLQFGIAATDGSAEFSVVNSVITVEGIEDQTGQYNNAVVLGIYTSQIDTVRILDNQVTTGSALNSDNRDRRTSTDAENGNDGEDARVGLNINGGDGGSGNVGMNGGAGGNAGNNSFEAGEPGIAGNGRASPVVVRGGTAGSAGVSTGGAGGPGGNGGDGNDGVRGAPGAGGAGYGAISNLTGAFTNSRGALGGKGWSGAGGGGGGGGAGGAAGANGGAGGGGGEGGEGGEGGVGAYNGNASIAIHVAGGTLNEISGNIVQSGNGGKGGVGGLGAPGGTGGSGGEGVSGTNGPVNAKGGKGGNGGDGGDGGVGGAGGSGGGGPSFAIFIGGNTPATIENNTLTTGLGGNGGNAYWTDEAEGAGRGGWSVGIFDGAISDSLTPVVSNNSFTIGSGGQDGTPRTGKGSAMNTNF